MRRRLSAAGLKTSTDVFASPESQLQEILGRKEGRLAFLLIRGLDDEPVEASGRAKTMSNEDNLGGTSDINRVMTAVEKNVQKLLLRLDEDYALFQRLPRTVRLSVVQKR